MAAMDLLLLRSASSPGAKRYPEAETKLRGELACLDRALAELDRERQPRFPQYARLIDTAALSRRDVMRLLAPDEVLVSFILGDRESYVLALTRHKLHLKPVDIGRQKLELMIETLRCGLDASQWMGGGRERPCGGLVGRVPFSPTEAALPFRLDVAHELYRSLLGSVEDAIRGRHLLIVPSGPLTSLPMHVLVTRKAQHAIVENVADYRDVAWLATTSATTILPSISSLRVLRTHARASLATEPFIGFGNPLLVGSDPDKPDKRAWDALTCAAAKAVVPVRTAGLPVRGHELFSGATVNVNAVREQPPLPETAVEICAVATMLKAPPDAIYLGEQAREATVKRLRQSDRLARYRVVHFATHGVMTGELEGLDEPALVLTPPTAQSETDDGLLTASEVAPLKLDADRVIMSASQNCPGSTPSTSRSCGL